MTLQELLEMHLTQYMSKITLRTLIRQLGPDVRVPVTSLSFVERRRALYMIKSTLELFAISASADILTRVESGMHDAVNLPPSIRKFAVQMGS